MTLDWVFSISPKIPEIFLMGTNDTEIFLESFWNIPEISHFPNANHSQKIPGLKSNGIEIAGRILPANLGTM